MFSRMSRIGALLFVATVAACSSCSKAADSQAEPNVNPKSTAQMSKGGGAGPAVTVGGPGVATPTQAGSAGAIDPQLRLHPDEGSLAIEVPPDAKAGSEVVAKVTLKPTESYHVNQDYPVKLVLDDQANVTLPKKELKKADADAFDERQLVFSVKLTPTQSGNYTVSGIFKFAVCTAQQCLPKKEPIAIQIAAK